MQRRFWIGISIAILLSSAATAWSQSSPSTEEKTIVVGAKTFTEQFILAKILTLMFEANGFAVTEISNVPTRVLREQLLNGEVDIYWEYTGTAYRAHLKQTDPYLSTQENELFDFIKHEDASNGVIWFNRSTANNTYALIVSKPFADQNNVTSISQLAQKYGEIIPLLIGTGEDFYVRPDGLQRMAKHYGFEIFRQRVEFIGHSAIYGNLKRGQIQVGVGYGTDPQIAQYDLITLNDDQTFFPIYNPAPIVRQEVLNRYPEIAQWLDRIGPLLDQSSMIRLNYQVDIEKQNIRKVAHQWLKQVGLL